MWGLVPLYWTLLKPASAAEILVNRMIFSLGFVAILLAVQRNWGWLRELTTKPRQLAQLALASLLISVNWGVFIWAVNVGRVVETSLGYFINPLVSIALGVLVFREKMRTLQWTAVGVGVAAAVVLTVGYGQLPWISLVLAGSFGLYGVLKKTVKIGAAEGLAIETATMFIPALGIFGWLEGTGRGTLTTVSIGHTALLVSTGLITVVPLLAFAGAARRLPLSTLGLFQYLAPTLQFIIGVFVHHEHMSATRWAGFALVWLAIMLLVADSLRTILASRALAREVSSTGPEGRTPVSQSQSG
jgi:chloramphenicol-sensitive protein RarD